MNRSHSRAALLGCGLLLALLAVPAGVTWRAWRQEKLNRSLIAAIKHNDDTRVTNLLNQGADVNTRSSSPSITFWQLVRLRWTGNSHEAKGGETALLFAVGIGRVDAVQALLAHHANVNIVNDNGWTAMKAAKRLRTESAAKIVRLLQHAGATTEEHARRK